MAEEGETDGSESNESNVLFTGVVKGNLVNESSLLSEERERVSSILHPLLRDYVRCDRNAMAWRVCRFIGVERMRGILALAAHAVAVVRDQLDGRAVAEAEEKRFMELTEPLHDLSWTTSALRWWAGC